jgi:hypothetical protein
LMAQVAVGAAVKRDLDHGETPNFSK